MSTALRPRVPRALPGNRRLHLAVAALVALVVVAGVALALRGGDDAGGPLPNDAARLVPSDALVYVHLSTDRGRPATARAERVAQRFPSYERLRDQLIARLSVRRCGLSTAELRGGREAALALLNAPGGTAGSLVLLDTGRRHDSAQPRTCGQVSVRYIGRWLAIGQSGSLVKAADLAAGKGRALTDLPAYRKGTDGLPGRRVADAWASADGVRRLLSPQGGLLGAAGGLLERPDLVGAAAALRAEGTRVRLTVRSVLARKATGTPFDPKLAASVPKDAIAYLGTRGLGGALVQLLAATGAGDGVGQAASALTGVAGDLRKALGAALQGEVAVVLTPDLPAPVLTLIAGAGDEVRTRAALRRAEGPLVKALVGNAKTTPAFATARVGRVEARVLRVSGLELAYAVFDGKLVAATKLDGIAKVSRADGAVRDTAGFRTTVGAAEKPVGSLVFLDFSQLLRLAEQTGLNDSTAYRAVKADLQEVGAVGATTTSAGDVTTAELVLSIP